MFNVILLRVCDFFRRQDKKITSSSRICSYHFKNELKDNRPTLFQRNSKQIFQFEDPKPPRKQTKRASAPLEEPSSAGCSHKIAPSSVALQVEVDMLRSQVSKLEKHLNNATKTFSFDSVNVTAL